MTMNTTEILSALDSEISRLKQIRDLLSQSKEMPRGRGSSGTSLEKQSLAASAEIAPKRGRGRPKGSSNRLRSSEIPPKRRTMSAAGRERIAAAQRARWAKQNAASAGTNKTMTSKAAASKVVAGKSAAPAAKGAARQRSAAKLAKTVAKKSSLASASGKSGVAKKTFATTSPSAKTAGKATAKTTKPAPATKPAKKARAKQAPAKQASSSVEPAGTRTASEAGETA